jgi:hypothetical protein
MLLPVLLLMLGGCGGDGLAGALRSTGAAGTPDEFLVLPTRPLEMPTDMNALPPPVPGARNRVDYEPREIAVTGLTGRPAPAGTASGGALVAATGPVNPQIRTQLAVEDVQWRSRNRGRLLERWFRRDQEALVYQDMTLDAGAEYQRLRSYGVRQPTAPPAMVDENR